MHEVLSQDLPCSSSDRLSQIASRLCATTHRNYCSEKCRIEIE